VPKDSVAPLLRDLAAACPADQAETATRLLLKSLAASDDKAPPANAATRDKVLKLLADSAAARSQMDVLTNYAVDIVKAVSAAGTPERSSLVEAFGAALKRLEADTSLSRADRITALYGRVELSRIDTVNVNCTVAQRAFGLGRDSTSVPSA
jgi:hypothetical protein